WVTEPEDATGNDPRTPTALLPQLPAETSADAVHHRARHPGLGDLEGGSTEVEPITGSQPTETVDRELFPGLSGYQIKIPQHLGLGEHDLPARPGAGVAVALDPPVGPH